MGLFCRDIGLFCGDIGLIESSALSARAMFSWSPRRCAYRIRDMKFFCGDIGLFCRDVGLFCGDVGLYCGDMGLFSRDIGLFCGDVGLILTVFAQADKLVKTDMSRAKARTCQGSFVDI